MAYEPPPQMSIDEFRRLTGQTSAHPSTDADWIKNSQVRRGLMNKTEARYDLYLKALLSVGQIRWYAFEPIKLRLATKTFWTPDFGIWMSIEHGGRFRLIDVKAATKTGRVLVKDDAQVKIKIAAKEFPMWQF